ncbi:hypothetical protein L3X38_025767 [Prunus dulcis]|uniref:Uncharacterized protein n=1 Tax=Prunus dulcis TaxID=3755 RepID=A0AAD4Z7Q6_PRUDU|nr:hypothetical protein L3X38_025767 [Prunus dulcis]
MKLGLTFRIIRAGHRVLSGEAGVAAPGVDSEQVQKLTEAKNVRIKTVIDPSLVAGFTVRYDNYGLKLREEAA